LGVKRGKRQDKQRTSRKKDGCWTVRGELVLVRDSLKGKRHPIKLARSLRRGLKTRERNADVVKRAK